MSDLNENMNNNRISYTFTMGAELIAYPVKSTDPEKTEWLHQYSDFGKLIDALPIGILIADSNHRIYFWNRTFCNYMDLKI